MYALTFPVPRKALTNTTTPPGDTDPPRAQPPQVDASVTLSSIVSQSLPGTTINLLPGTYDDPDHCYMVFNQSDIRLIAVHGGVTFSCSACAGAALVLAASGTELRGIVFQVMEEGVT